MPPSRRRLRTGAFGKRGGAPPPVRWAGDQEPLGPEEGGVGGTDHLSTRRPLAYRGRETRWTLVLPVKPVEELGWRHRDDIAAQVVGGELRVRKLGPRDVTRDHVPGGRDDPFTGQISPPPAAGPEEVALGPALPPGDMALKIEVSPLPAPSGPVVRPLYRSPTLESFDPRSG